VSGEHGASIKWPVDSPDRCRCACSTANAARLAPFSGKPIDTSASCTKACACLTFRDHRLTPTTGAGEDNGIDHNKNCLRIPYDSTFLRSHCLHPHPRRMPQLKTELIQQRRAASSSSGKPRFQLCVLASLSLPRQSPGRVPVHVGGRAGRRTGEGTGGLPTTTAMSGWCTSPPARAAAPPSYIWRNRSSRLPSPRVSPTRALAHPSPTPLLSADNG
jgi:hypothetical protein